MKIFLIETDGAGGMIHYAFQMAAALEAEGAEVTLVTGRHYELAGVEAPFRVEPILRLWPAIESPASNRLERWYRKGRRVFRALRFFREWRRMSDLVLEEFPDVVQFSTIRFPLQALGLRRLERAGLRLTQVCHEFEPREARFGLLRRLQRRLATQAYRAFGVMFFHGRAHRDRFEELYDAPARKVLIPHGDESLLASLADPGGNRREAYGIAPHTPVVLFFGGLRPSKGLPDLVEAVAAVRERLDAHLLIVGNPAAGFDADELKEQARELGISDRVTIDARYVDLNEIGPIIRTASVVALPYRSGTASGVLQAAYTFDRPVVVTDVGSLAEAVDHGRTGFVVPPRDPAAMATALEKVVADDSTASAFGEAAGRYGREGFGWAPIAETIIAEYRGSSR